MLKHSRWSGRRLMPSGGGWMTPNPSGGVAACLVWNKDSQQPVACVTSAAVTAARHASKDADDQALSKTPATYGDVNVATSVTVVPPQPTVVIAPTCSCCCTRHHINTITHSADNVAPSRSAATQHMRSSCQHWPVKDQLQHGGCCCNTGDCHQKHLNVDSANDDSCICRRTRTTSTAYGDRHVRCTNTSITASHDGEAVIGSVDAGQRTVRPAWTSAYRSRPVRDAKVDTPAKQAVSRTADCHRLPNQSSDRQSEPDFATCTDQLTTNIYASLAAYQDDQENDVIDAVRGYLRRQPSPGRRRPSTGRWPATPADNGESRTVQLRQGDVGPLSSLVVIRPATPQARTSRTNGRPATARDDQRRTASEAATVGNNRHRVSWQDSRQADQHQRNHCHNHHQRQQQQQYFCFELHRGPQKLRQQPANMNQLTSTVPGIP